MSATAEKSKETDRNIVTVYGKVTAVRKLRNNTTKEPFFISLLALPNMSGDEFSHPQTVEIMSDSEIGKKDEVVTVRCAIGGYGRVFNQTDKDTGEITKIRTADNSLRAV